MYRDTPEVLILYRNELFLFTNLYNNECKVYQKSYLRLPRKEPYYYDCQYNDVTLTIRRLSIKYVSYNRRRSTTSCPRTHAHCSAFLYPSETILRPPRLRSSLFLEARENKGIPNNIKRTSLLPHRSVSLQNTNKSRRRKNKAATATTVLGFLHPCSVFAKTVNYHFALSEKTT